MEKILRFEPKEFVVKTSGDGLWTTVSKEVDVESLEMYRNGSELFVKFFLRDWNNARDGLVYTDPGFLRGVKSRLLDLDPQVNWRKLSYTEQGMQGGHRWACPKRCRKKECREFVHTIVGTW